MMLRAVAIGLLRLADLHFACVHFYCPLTRIQVMLIADRQPFYSVTRPQLECALTIADPHPLVHGALLLLFSQCSRWPHQRHTHCYYHNGIHRRALALHQRHMRRMADARGHC
jgi:hypothetical protein